MSFLFGRSRAAANRKIIERLNEGVVAAVRAPVFYSEDGVPDTLDGRFELLVLHLWLVARHLRMQPPPGPAVAQDLIDLVFRHLDFTLREHGVGDLSVPKRMKRLAEAFLGRSVAYDAALRAGDASALAEALARNIYEGRRPAADLACYVAAAWTQLEATSLDDLLAGALRFPDPTAFIHPAVA